MSNGQGQAVPDPIDPAGNGDVAYQPGHHPMAPSRVHQRLREHQIRRLDVDLA